MNMINDIDILFEEIRKRREMSKFAKDNDYGYAETEVTQAEPPSKVDILAGHLAPKTVDPFENGDVIKFKVHAGRTYSYAALKAAGMFYATGDSSLVARSGMTFKQFLDVLNRDDVSDIRISSEWRDVQ